MLGAPEPDPGISEADDVRATVARHVGEEARVLFDTPPGGVTEIPDDQLWCLEGAVAVIERDPDPGVSEADDVRTTSPVRSARKRGWRSTRQSPAL